MYQPRDRSLYANPLLDWMSLLCIVSHERNFNGTINVTLIFLINAVYNPFRQAVEAALLELSQVNACVVIVTGAEGEEKSLVAYVVPEGPTTKKAIRAILKKRLPFYMIPAHFVFLQRYAIVNWMERLF